MKYEVIYNLKLIESATRMELNRKNIEGISDEDFVNHTSLYINVIQTFLDEMKESINHLQ